MSKEENAKEQDAQTVKETAAEKKARIAAERKDAKEAKAKERAEAKAEKERLKAEAKANKPPGIIASILEFVKASKTPISQESIHVALVDRFPDKDPAGMMKTVKAQLGGKSQPTRMEKEKGVEFEITFVQVEETIKGKDGEADQVQMVDSKEKLYLYKGEVEKS